MNVIIRPARPQDATQIARVHVSSWRSTYPGMLPSNYLVRMSVPVQAERWRRQLRDPQRAKGTFVVAASSSVTGTGVVGFGSCGAQRTALDGFRGEFYTIYLLDEVQGFGLGRHLMAAMAADMMGGGMDSALVWVLGNNPARWFYERLGGEKVAEMPSEFAGGAITEVAYGWRDLAPLARLSAGPRVR
ncbi:MAG TPA: GNAT family N-acetyltransferase [Azospirillaceae bacterium]|nr:GNAT family N-acetyltransferase [Azospirillaceae bacterium]